MFVSCQFVQKKNVEWFAVHGEISTALPMPTEDKVLLWEVTRLLWHNFGKSEVADQALLQWAEWKQPWWNSSHIILSAVEVKQKLFFLLKIFPPRGSMWTIIFVFPYVDDHKRYILP